MLKCGQGILVLGLMLVLAGPAQAQAKELPKEYRPAVDKGLAWLVKQQQRDGRWEGVGGKFPTATTSLAGLALLMEGSTLREGKYRPQLQKATDWLLAQARPNGLIVEAPFGGGHYMMQHGYAMLFLACAAGDLENGPQKRRLMTVLERSAAFAVSAQTSRGGWGYVSSRDGSDFDEIAATLIVLQGMRAAHLGGARIDPAALKRGRDYLEKSTLADGGILYSLTTKTRSSAPLAGAALAVGLDPGEYSSLMGNKWLGYCQKNIIVPGRIGAYTPFLHFYYAQTVYQLGDDRYALLFPTSRPAERITWTRYRKALFDELVRTQGVTGEWAGASWAERAVGPVYGTAVALFVLQLDNAAVPLFCRRP